MGGPTRTVALDGAQPADVEPGSVLGRFVVREQIGVGGMGRVFRAHDPRLDRQVALKLLHRHTDGNDRRRMAREAQAMAALSHPNIVPIFDIGEVHTGAGRSMFITMELVEGRTLSGWFEAKVRSFDEILEVFVAAGEGLAAAHEAGLVHRDFKPSNVLVDEDGRARVLDFGLARAMDSDWSDPASEEDRAAASSSMLGHSMTMTGVVVGTPAYMAPEQHTGKVLDHRCDQYAFCVVLWEAVYGTRPFLGTDVDEVFRAKRSGRPLAPAGATVPKALRALLERGLAYEAVDRFGSMRALLDQLRAVPTPGRRRRRMWMGGGAAAVLGAGAVAVVSALGGPPEPVPCEGAAARLEGVWDAPTRAEVEQSIGGAELAYAQQTWERLGPVLDDYAERWAAAHTEACRATLVEHTQDEAVMDRRMRCLDDGRAHLDGLVQMLRGAEASVVRRAVVAATTLPAIEDCSAERSVERQKVVPDDAAAREVVEEIRAQLGRVWALERAGRYADALELAVTLEDRAAAVDFRPIVAEVAVAVAREQQHLGRHDEAADRYRRGYFDAKAEGLDLLAAEAAVGLAYVVGHRQGKYQEALDVWAKHATTALDRVDSPPLRAELLNTIALMHRHQGRLDEALESYRRSLEIREREPSVSSVRVLSGIGTALANKGQYEEALEYHQRALAEESERLGSMHPQRGVPLINIGVTYSKWGKLDEALEYQLQALTLWKASLEPDHPNITDAMHNIAMTYTRQERYDEALEYQHEVLKRFEAQYGSEHTYTGDSLYSIALIHFGRQEYEQAASFYGRSLAVFEAALGSEHEYVADALSGLGRSRLKLEDGAGAVAPLERALAIRVKREAGLGATAELRLSLAQALVRADGDRERARALGLQAREGYVEGEDSEAVARVDAWMAEAL